VADEVKTVLGRKFAVPVARGRDALWLALNCLQVTPADEIVLPSYVCKSVLEAVVLSGAIPKFADVGNGLHVTSSTVTAALTPRTRCVIVPHLFGDLAPIVEIESVLRRRNIALIDDAAQGFGAQCGARKVGAFGEFGVVCGGPGKPLATVTGAVLVMDSPEYYHRANTLSLPVESTAVILKRILDFWVYRRFRRYTAPLEVLRDRLVDSPSADPDPHGVANLDAALMQRQIDRVWELANRRIANARRLIEVLAPLGWQILTDVSGEGLALKLTILLPPSGPPLPAVLRAFAHAGIECQAGYAPCHPSDDSSCAVTASLWNRVLCMPVESAFPKPERLSEIVTTLSEDSCRAAH
jgi:dTDP-4-amino-4,6-dideoxygalactose transaminase